MIILRCRCLWRMCKMIVFEQRGLVQTLQNYARADQHLVSSSHIYTRVYDIFGVLALGEVLAVQCVNLVPRVVPLLLRAAALPWHVL